MAMLQGISGANSVQEKKFGGNKFAPLPAGGYVCKILGVAVDKADAGSTFIKLRIDVAEGEHAGYFSKRFAADASSRYGQKWKGVYKIFLPNFAGDNNKYMDDIGRYKGNINMIARSNNIPEPNIEQGYDPDIFKGCTVGILFREATYRGNKFTEPAFLCDVQKIRSGDYEIPEPRFEKQNSTGFYNVQQPAQSGSVFAAAAQQQNPFAQFAQPQQTQPQAFQQPAQNAAPQPALDDLSDFEEIINTGDVPF